MIKSWLNHLFPVKSNVGLLNLLLLNTSGHVTTLLTNFPIISHIVSELHTQTLAFCPKTEVVCPFFPRSSKHSCYKMTYFPSTGDTANSVICIPAPQRHTNTHMRAHAHAGISLQRLPQAAVKLVTRFEFVIMKYFVCI